MRRTVKQLFQKTETWDAGRKAAEMEAYTGSLSTNTS